MKQTAKEYLKDSGQEYEFTESERSLVIDLLEGFEEQLRIGDVGSSMLKLCGNTTNKEYAGFTDQIISVSKNGQTVVLEPEDLKKLEQVVGGKFRR